MRDDIHEKTRSDVTTGARQHVVNDTMAKWQLVEHNVVVVIDVLLFSCAEICKPAFAGCSVWKSWEPLNLQLLFSETLSSAGRSRNLLFTHSVRKLYPLFTSPVFDIPKDVKFFGLSEQSGVCRSSLWIYSLKIAAKGRHGLGLKVPCYRLKVLLDGEGRDIGIKDKNYLDWTYFTIDTRINYSNVLCVL